MPEETGSVPTVHVNGIDLFYEEEGRGDPVLLIPGLGGDVADYGRAIQALGRRARVVAVDNRGSGRSDKPDIPYTIEMMADDAAALLGALRLGSVWVLGHSMGGRVALDLALRHPGCVKGLILVSTSARAPPGTRRRVRFLGGFWKRNPVLQRLDRHPQPYYAFLRQFEASRSYDATSRLREIRMPTLILQGTRDRLAPVDLANEMHTLIQGSRMTLLRGGHLMFFFQPEACVRAIEDFFDAPGPRPGAPPLGS